MTLTLSENIEDRIKRRIATGAFANAEEVIDAALARWDGEEIIAPFDPEWLKAELLKGVRSPASPWRGKEEIDEIMQEIKARRER